MRYARDTEQKNQSGAVARQQSYDGEKKKADNARLKRAALKKTARQSARNRVNKSSPTTGGYDTRNPFKGSERAQKKGMGHGKPGQTMPTKSNPNPLLRKRMQASAAKRKAAGKAPASQKSINALRKRASARMAARRPSAPAPNRPIVGGSPTTYAPKAKTQPLIKKKSLLNPKKGNGGGGGYNRFSNRSKPKRPFDKYQR